MASKVSCFYFAHTPKPSYDMPDELYCSDHGWTGGPEGLFQRSRCGEGEPCLFFHETGSCTVECTQRCECNVATGKLICHSTPCP